MTNELGDLVVSGKDTYLYRNDETGINVISNFLENDKKEDEMEEENLITLTHHNDYLYYKYDAEKSNKDFLYSK